MKSDFDNIIKSAISEEMSGLPETDDIFNRIREELSIETCSKNKGRRHYIGYSFRKYAVFAVCLFIVSITITFNFSSQARALASQAISSVKNIFDIEVKDNKFQVVEKPSNEAYFTYSTGKVTQLNDTELSDKLGYEVKFPQLLGDGFRLDQKNLGVGVSKPLNLEQSKQIQNDMENAIEDDNALEQLKPYNVSRYAVGLYSKSDGSTIFINVSIGYGLADIESNLAKYGVVQGQKIQKVKVGKFSGYWIESSIPVYSVNSAGEQDMTVRPDMVESSSLKWEKNGIFYSLCKIKEDFKLTFDEALKIAEDFMMVN